MTAIIKHQYTWIDTRKKTKNVCLHADTQDQVEVT